MLKIFDAIATTDSNNLIILRKLVDGYFQGVESHNRIHSSFLLQSTKDAQLTETKGFMKTLRLDARIVYWQRLVPSNINLHDYLPRRLN